MLWGIPIWVYSPSIQILISGQKGGYRPLFVIDVFGAQRRVSLFLDLLFYIAGPVMIFVDRSLQQEEPITRGKC